ncbi:MAG: right-handed parallel beta-helix repeat-containing protein, partial [Thermoplasmatota archaeon]
MNAKGISFLLVAVLTLSGIGLVFSSQSHSSGSETRFTPEIARGPITSDQTWDGTFYTTDIVIREGVTVNVTAGSTWRHPDNSYTYVEGTLIVEGTNENPVIIEELVTDQGWRGIHVNQTGKIIFQNFTITDLNSPETGLELRSMANRIENGSISGGQVGISSQLNLGGHSIENIDFYEQKNSAITLATNLYKTRIQGIRTFDVTVLGIGLGICQNVEISDVEIYRTIQFGVYMESLSSTETSDITVSNLTVMGKDTQPTMAGLAFTGFVTDIEFDEVVIDYCALGINIGTIPRSEISFDRLRIGNGVGKGIYQTAPEKGIDLTVSNSGIYSDPDIIDIRADDGNTTIDLIETYLKETSSIDIKEGGVVKIYWNADVQVVDGKGKPANVTREIFEDQGQQGKMCWYEIKLSGHTSGQVQEIVYHPDQSFTVPGYPPHIL